VWRYLFGGLGDRHDLMAVDLPGCGNSDHPTPADAGPDGYGPASLAKSVLLVLRERIAARKTPPRLTLVGHSLGGTVILRMFADPALRQEFADVLERVEGMVLFAPVDVFVDTNQPAFRAVVETSDLMIAIAGPLGVVRERVSAATLTGVCDASRAIREEADRVVEVLLDRPRRHAAQAMLRQAVPIDDAGRLDVQRAAKVSAGYTHVRPPCLIVWGESDDVLPQSMGYKLASDLPNARLRIMTKGMHCLPTERPTACVGLVQDFVSTQGGGGGGGPRVATVDGISGRTLSPADLAFAADPKPAGGLTKNDGSTAVQCLFVLAHLLTVDMILRWSH
jgi:pimeloyl-ACP methyl ester carboxylesterase